MKKIEQILFLMSAMAALLGGGACAAADTAKAPVVLAPFYTKSEFVPAAAGTYELPPLGKAADGKVLDTDGRELKLRDLLGDGRVVLLGFIYSNCSDVNGCPLTTAVMYNIAKKISAIPQ